MDTLHSVLFYAFAALTVAGGLAAALLENRARPLGVAAVAVGLAGLEADLGAVLAALATLAGVGAGAALLLRLTGRGPHLSGWEPGVLPQQLGALLAGAIFLVLAYVAFRGAYTSTVTPSGAFNVAAVARLLLGRDALAAVALAAAPLVALVVARPAARPAVMDRRR